MSFNTFSSDQILLKCSLAHFRKGSDQLGDHFIPNKVKIDVSNYVRRNTVMSQHYFFRLSYNFFTNDVIMVHFLIQNFVQKRIMRQFNAKR